MSLRVLIDTNAYSAYRRGQSEALKVIETCEELAIPLIVWAELVTGFIGGNRPEENRSSKLKA